MPRIAVNIVRPNTSYPGSHQKTRPKMKLVLCKIFTIDLLDSCFLCRMETYLWRARKKRHCSFVSLAWFRILTLYGMEEILTSVFCINNLHLVIERKLLSQRRRMDIRLYGCCEKSLKTFISNLYEPKPGDFVYSKAVSISCGIFLPQNTEPPKFEIHDDPHPISSSLLFRMSKYTSLDENIFLKIQLKKFHWYV